MAVSFLRGQQLGRNDLNIFLTNASGLPVNAAEIAYALYDFTTGMEVLVGSPRRVPSNPSVGEYYASIVVPLDANLGSYRIRWTMREMVGSPLQSVVQEFEVRDREMKAPVLYTDTEADLMRRARILLRDNSPDRNYRFRPPAHEETIDQFSRVFGYIWEDEELLEYLQRGLDMIVSAPPRTPFASLDQMVQARREWTTLLLTGSMYWALQALQINWTADEFSIAPETKVRVILPNREEVDIQIKELYSACYELSEEVGIRNAFQMGVLRVWSVTPFGQVKESEVTAVLRHAAEEKDCIQVTLVGGQKVIVTTDHSLVSMKTGLPVAVPSGQIEVGEPIAMVQYGKVFSGVVKEIREVDRRSFMYDLSVPGLENFVLSNGILAHNSYSIGGVSLDIEKASKYESLKQGMSEQFDKMLEKAKATVKITKGLQQPRYGMGIRSSFGPYTSRGILQPAKFLGM